MAEEKQLSLEEILKLAQKVETWKPYKSYKGYVGDHNNITIGITKWISFFGSSYIVFAEYKGLRIGYHDAKKDPKIKEFYSSIKSKYLNQKSKEYQEKIMEKGIISARAVLST